MVEQIVHPVPRQVVHLVRLVRLVRLKATLVNPWDLHLSLQGRVVLHLTLTIIQARGRQCIQVCHNLVILFSPKVQCLKSFL
jgi:hypothetical protein